MSEFGKARPATHKDLTAAFGGLLPRNEAVAPSPVAEPDQEADQLDPGAQTTAEPTLREGPQSLEVNEKKPARRKADPPASSAAQPKPATTKAAASSSLVSAPDSKADQPIQISLPISVEARLLAFKAETGLSHPNILFNAIEDRADSLPDLIKARTVQLGTTTGTSLFSRPQTAAKRDTTTEPKKSFIIRITKQNKEVLDSLTKTLAAPSRMVLIVTAYDAYLPQLPTK